jgi:HlyD family secretion protein
LKRHGLPCSSLRSRNSGIASGSSISGSRSNAPPSPEARAVCTTVFTCHLTDRSFSPVSKTSAAQLKQKVEVNQRRQDLAQKGVVSRETAADTQAAADMAKADLSQARSAVSVARANLEQANAVLALEEARLAKYRLYVPFDGMVMTRYRELGSALSANEAVFQLVDPATIWALAYIDEGRAGPIEVGQPAEVVRRSAPDLHMKAKVVRIDIESDRVNEERRVYVRCGGCPLTFHVGEQAEVVITVATLPQARLVKQTALVKVQGRQATAWTVEDGRLQQRKVTLGQRTLDGRVEIVGGVPEGAELVTGPTSGLAIGRRVVIASSDKVPGEKKK